MAYAITPRSALFATFKTYGGISNADLAEIILADVPSALGKPLKDKVKDRAWLSRAIVNESVAEADRYPFAPFEVSVPKLTARLIRGSGSKKGKTDTELLEFFGGEAADEMIESLAENHLNSSIYQNMMDWIKGSSFRTVDKALLLISLYVVTGCTASPQKAVSFAQQYANSLEGHGMATIDASSLPDDTLHVEASQPAAKLTLLRIKGSAIVGKVHVLSNDSRGNEIGRLATSNNGITDVGPNVSRKHLIIWLAKDNNWYARGCGSANGTILVHGETGEETVIEPRKKHQRDWANNPVRIQPGDKLLLADDTEFLIMEAN